MAEVNDYQLTHGIEENNADLASLSFDDEEDPQTEEFQAPEEPEDYYGQEPYQGTQEEDSVLDRVLRSKGITDSTKIKFADENDNIIERDWNDLSAEEQYNILTSQTSDIQEEDYEEAEEPNLSDEEISFLNYLRTNNLSPSEYLNYVVQQSAQPVEPDYEIDQLSDDELFIGDLQIRTPDITDDELLDALQKAKENPELFNKQIQGLRQEYKDLEDQNREEQAILQQEQDQASYQQFQEEIFEGIDSLNTLGEIDIELSDEDKEELATFILQPDQAGVTELQKVLADPATLAQVAWFLLKGSDTIDGLVQYFTKEITKVRENSFKKGQEQKQKPAVYIKQKNEPSRNSRAVTSIDDLD